MLSGNRKLAIATIVLSVLVWVSLAFSIIYYGSVFDGVGKALFMTQWGSRWTLALPGAGIALAISTFICIRKSDLHSYGRFFVIVALTVSLLGIFTVVGLGVLDGLEEARLQACVTNMKQIYGAFVAYADKNAGQFPPISNTKNNFIFNTSTLYPMYLRDVSVLTCPSNPAAHSKNSFRLRSTKHHEGASVGDVHPDCITDASYCYLSWAVLSDEEAQTFFEGYDNLSPQEYDKNLAVPEGMGNLKGEVLNYENLRRGNVIYRLSLEIRELSEVFDMDDLLGSHGNWACLIPLLWDKHPYHKMRYSSSPRRRPCGIVLYLDGHVESVAWGDKFPMTEAFARMLDERKRQPIPDCDE